MCKTKKYTVMYTICNNCTVIKKLILHLSNFQTRKCVHGTQNAPAGTQVNGQTDRETGTVCNRKFEALI